MWNCRASILIFDRSTSFSFTDSLPVFSLYCQSSAELSAMSRICSPNATGTQIAEARRKSGPGPYGTSLVPSRTVCYPRLRAERISIGRGHDRCPPVFSSSGSRVIRKEDLHETDYTPWEGHQVGAWRSLTILHGKIVMTRSVF